MRLLKTKGNAADACGGERARSAVGLHAAVTLFNYETEFAAPR
jgi:hypothetical protein